MMQRANQYSVFSAAATVQQTSNMGFMTMNKQFKTVSRSSKVQVRSFSTGNYPEHIVLEMPNLSPTMEKGNIKAWLKQVGDEVAPGDVLAAIETDKATVDFEMQEDGYVAALLFPEGAKDVPLGEIVAVLVENKEDIAAFANYSAGDSTAAAEPVPVQATPAPVAQASSPAVNYPEHIELEMPNLSPTMEKVNKLSVYSNILNLTSYYRETSKNGLKMSETKSHQVMFSLPLRLTRLLLTSKCRRKASLPLFCTLKELRILNSERLSPFLLRTRKMLQLSRTTTPAKPVLLPLLPSLLKPRLPLLRPALLELLLPPLEPLVLDSS